jgi:hypothetical protein
MVLKFSLDPQTGVVVPPVTVFNGGKRSGATAKRSGATAKRKAKKTRKSKKTRRSKTQRRRR